MNRKGLIVTFLLSVFCCLVSCESKKEVDFTTFKNGERENVEVVFQEGEIALGEQIIVKNSSKLEEGATTVFTSDIYLASNKTIDGKAVVFCFRKVKNIAQRLDLLADKKKYIKENESELKEKLTTIKSVAGYKCAMVLDTKVSDLKNKMVFRIVL